MTTLNNKAALKSPIGLLATWFGSGLFPKAPGTMGTIAALPFAWGIVEYWGIMALLYAAIIVSIIGVPISNAYMKQFNREHDPKEVVIDEVAGIWLTIAGFLVPVQAEILPVWVLLGSFVLFRLFDIWKPWPISWADKKVGGGLGVMLDDVLAAIVAIIVGYILTYTYFMIVVCSGGTCVY